MHKSLLALTFLVLALPQIVRGDDLFSTGKLESPFAGGKAVEAPASANQSGKGFKLANANQLAEVLRDAGLDAKIEADSLVTFRFPTGKLEFPVAFNLTEDNARIFIVIIVAQLENEKQLAPEQLLGLLNANRDLRPAFFAYSATRKRMELFLSIANENISARSLVSELKSLSGIAEQTAKLWQPAPLNGSQNNVANNGQPNNGQPNNGQPNNGQPNNGQPNNGQQNVAQNNGPPQNNQPPANPIKNAPNNNNQTAQKNPPGDANASNPANGPAKNTAPPAAAAKRVSPIAGKWAAAVSDKEAVAVQFTNEGNFALVLVKDNKPFKINGTFTLAGTTLSMKGTDGTAITGALAPKELSFDFTPQSGPIASKVTFKKQ